jgi:hypothetical protein
MVSMELYNALENAIWLELTSKESPYQNVKWQFYQPASGLEGLYMCGYSYQGRPQTESGKYSIEVIDGRAVVKIKDAEFYLNVKNRDTQMTWNSKSGIERNFTRQE